MLLSSSTDPSSLNRLYIDCSLCLKSAFYDLRNDICYSNYFSLFDISASTEM